jgi:hypothetical protein
MRRRLVPLVFVLAVLALGAWSGSAGAIICPVPTTRASTPCCGPPVAAPDVVPGCCQTPCCQTSCCGPSTCCGAGGAQTACPIIAITIGASPDPSVAGQKVTITGRLLNGGAGKTVDLWQKLPGQSRFTRVAQATTNSSGDYTIVRRAGTVQTNTSWYATTSSATSATVFQRVSAQVKLVSWAVAGGLVRLNGRVSPSHRGERLALQRRTANGWRTIGSTVIGRLSKFTLRHHFANKGSVVLRALFAGDARNMQSASVPVRLSVR